MGQHNTTIQEVQGLTLSEVVVSCDGFFGLGQFYVAASRVTHNPLSSLHYASKIKETAKAADALR